MRDNDSAHFEVLVLLLCHHYSALQGWWRVPPERGENQLKGLGPCPPAATMYMLCFPLCVYCVFIILGKSRSGFFLRFPVCMAKTQYSFSTDPDAKGAPTGHIVPIRELRLSAGAEFVVVVTGEIMTMPGLPRVPAADNIYLNKKGEVEGLF